jgi:hypothetical protein
MGDLEERFTKKVVEREVCVHETWTMLETGVANSARTINEGLCGKSTLCLTLTSNGQNSIRLGSNRGRDATLVLDESSRTVSMSGNPDGACQDLSIGGRKGEMLRVSQGLHVNDPNLGRHNIVPPSRSWVSWNEIVEEFIGYVLDLKGGI